MGTNATTFPEWARARQGAKPEDDAQKKLVGLLEQPIASSETQKIAVRRKALQDLADGLTQASAARMRDRLKNPGDALGQFTTFELSPQLRDDLIKRIDTRAKTGSTSTGPQQRGTQTPTPVQQKKQQSTDPSSTGSAGFPFLYGPPVVIPFPGITSPQYFPNGFPPLGIFFRPVLLVPEVQYGPAVPDKKDDKKKPPPPPPKKTKDPKDKDDKDKDKKKKPRKTVLPPARTGPGILDWLQDKLTHGTQSAALMIGGLLLTLPADAVGAALAAAAGIFEGGGTVGEAGEAAAKKMLEWTLDKAKQKVFDVNNIRKNFPGVDLMTKVRPIQVKMLGVLAKGTKIEAARAVINAMETLYGHKQWLKLPLRTAKALLAVEDLLTQEGAWPASWPAKPSTDQLEELLRDTAFGVPDDIILDTRRVLGEKLASDPSFRELIPQLRIGSKADLKTLSVAAQRSWGEKAGSFVMEHVIGVGATSDQLRTMAAAGKEIVAP